MILIINTTEDKTVSEELASGLKRENAKFETVEAGGMKISHCIGCNYCWLKTPGICSIKDDYEEILKKMVNAEQIWVISNTALGFLDHKGKNIYDRILPLATMYLKFSGTQMRHVRRYSHKKDMGLIFTGDADREYLERWNARAALNFESRSLGVFSNNEVKEAIACML